jgi:hypothetical protein
MLPFLITQGFLMTHMLPIMTGMLYDNLEALPLNKSMCMALTIEKNLDVAHVAIIVPHSNLRVLQFGVIVKEIALLSYPRTLGT